MNLLQTAGDLVPYVLLLVAMVTGALGVRTTLTRFSDPTAPHRPSWLRIGVHFGLAAFAAVLALFLGLGDGSTQPGDVIGLLGLVVTVILTLSSTTFVSNAMAGLALHVVRNFRAGDYLQVGEHFGRVTEREWLHVEIQTPDRTLTTFPNLFLVTHPVTVVPATGTLVSAEVSLGYDVDHTLVSKVLQAAATSAGLDSPFVLVRELGDFSIVYRVSGLLVDVSQLITARSRLRECMLDALHGADIEIVSPSFMNQRQLDPTSAVVPGPRLSPSSDSAGTTAEVLAFDKANRAAVATHMESKAQALAQEIEELEASLSDREGEDRTAAELAITQRRAHREAIGALLERLKQEVRDEEANGG